MSLTGETLQTIKQQAKEIAQNVSEQVKQTGVGPALNLGAQPPQEEPQQKDLSKYLVDIPTPEQTPPN
ncbi:hypothetical protein [Helicobacter cynogastricus]|uniref:hypothetical protein n=1 Tax=Helicobacter cynogastricus TaxID=329937 RepID=UPI000CF1A716|nr:hypothetical protein [Helicobacter cynogastricus]